MGDIVKKKPTYEELEKEVSKLRRKIAEFEPIIDRNKNKTNLQADLTALIENTDDIIVFRDLEGRILLKNEAFKTVTRRLFGVEVETGMSTTDLLPPDKRKYWEDVLSRVLRGERIREEFSYSFDNGDIRHYDISFNPVIKDGKIVGCSEINRDVTERKNSEEALRKSQKMLERTESIAHIGSWEWEIAADKVTWSEELYRIFQLNPDGEAPNWENHPKLYHPEDFKKLRQAAETAITDGKPYELELRAFRKDGETRFCKAIGVPESGKSGQVVRLFGLLQDITDKKRYEDEMRKGESFLRTLLDAIPIPVFYKDTDGRYLGFNKSFEVFFGKDEGDLLGKSVFDINPPDLAKIYFTKDQELLEAGGTQQYETQIQNASGDRKDVIFNKAVFRDPDGKVGGLIGAILDITKRKQSEAALRESEDFLNRTGDMAKVGGWEVDLDTMKVVWTQTTGRIHELPNGYFPDLEEAIGYYHPDDQNHVRQCVQRAIESSEPFDFTVRLITAKGRERWVRALGQPIFDSGSCVRLSGTFQDITERLKLEEELRQAQKMESIGNLAGGIAHDFNNILSSIIGFTELALDETSKGTTLEDSLQEVYSAGKRAKELVRQILAFARQSEENRSPIQPSTVAKEVLKFIRSTIPTTIKIEQVIESDSWVMGNTIQIHQVLMNLCTNAAHAMEDSGGTLELNIRDMFVDKTDAAIGMRQWDYVEITVSDTGVGIPPEAIDSIFEPYFTTKGIGEGTGLGLAVAHGIIESYGGKITFESELGKGTKFTICLPIAKKRSGQDAYVPEQLPTGTERILFVDDEAPIAKMGGQILERLGYSVTTRTSSIEALELFQVRPNDFDLVVTDMTMPNLTGDKLAVELMKIRPDIPVILCTGYSKKISDEIASELGIKAFAYKPVVKVDLAKTVRKVLDEAKG